MLFGPTNGPATFVSFIYDIDSIWKMLTASRGIPIGDTTNTRIIIDNIVSWLSTEEYALKYRLVWATLKTIASSAILDL